MELRIEKTKIALFNPQFRKMLPAQATFLFPCAGRIQPGAG
jgi:hypothetical protein